MAPRTENAKEVYRKNMLDPEWQRAQADRKTNWKANNMDRWVPIQLRASAKKRSVKTGVPYDLDQHVFPFDLRVSRMKCELSGVELTYAGRSGERLGANSITVDRAIPHLGYVYSNIRIVAWCVNSAMGAWGEERAAFILRRWLDRRELI